MDDGAGVFIGMVLGFIFGIIVGVKGCSDVEDMGGAGKYCYPNLTCDDGLTCVKLTNQRATCSKPEDITPFQPEQADGKAN